MKKKINIEFIGMPGSGKTFFQHLIGKNKEFKNFKIIKNNFKILNKAQKFLYILLFVIQYPIFFLRTIFLLYKIEESKVSKKRHFYFFYNEMALRAYCNFFKENCIYVNSEGFWYRAYFYFQKKIIKKKLINYLKTIPKIDILIFMNSSKKLNLERVNKRKNEYKYSKEDLKNYDKNSKLLKKIISCYKNNSSELVILNNRNKDKKKNLNNVKNLIKNLIY